MLLGTWGVRERAHKDHNLAQWAFFFFFFFGVVTGQDPFPSLLFCLSRRVTDGDGAVWQSFLSVLSSRVKQGIITFLKTYKDFLVYLDRGRVEWSWLKIGKFYSILPPFSSIQMNHSFLDLVESIFFFFK